MDIAAHKKKATERRRDKNTRYRDAKSDPDKKILILDIWADLLVDIDELITDATAANDEQDLVLLRAAKGELTTARTDLMNNPHNWTLRDMNIVQRRILHLLLGVNPFTTNPLDWEV